jgi:hypothetical protein
VPTVEPLLPLHPDSRICDVQPLPTFANFFCTDSGSNLHGESHEPDQVKRVVLLIAAALDFKHRVDTNTLMPLRIRGVLPVCMAGMRRIFGTTRVPGREKDEIKTYEVPENGDAHVLLIIGSCLFCLPVLVEGLRVSDAAMEKCIREAVEQADAQAASQWGSGREAQPCVSLLTSSDRTSWAERREQIIRSSPRNAAGLRDVESALFSVSLLDRAAPSAAGRAADKGYIVTPERARRGEGDDWCAGGELAPSEIDMRAYAKEVLHGDGRGIWFDKSFTIVAFTDGRVGFHYEHTYADAPVPGLMCEHTYINTNPRAASSRVYQPLSLPTTTRAVSARLVQWRSEELPSLAQWLAQADVAMKLLVSQVDICPIHWLAFGASSLKTLSISPDAFCQAVLQVAALQYFGKHVLTYESASLRAFYHGRTECIRTASPLMTSFARDYVRLVATGARKGTGAGGGERGAEEQALRARLLAAGKMHSRLVKRATQMEGVDRHLLGLRLAALTSGAPTPALFQGEGWNTEFLLTTSQSPIVQEHLKVAKAAAECQSFGGGFGATALEGVGCSYHILPDRLYFYPSCRSDAAQDKCDKMAALVRGALHGLHRLLAQGATESAAVPAPPAPRS